MRGRTRPKSGFCIPTLKFKFKFKRGCGCDCPWDCIGFCLRAFAWFGIQGSIGDGIGEGVADDDVIDIVDGLMPEIASDCGCCGKSGTEASSPAGACSVEPDARKGIGIGIGIGGGLAH